MYEINKKTSFLPILFNVLGQPLCIRIPSYIRTKNCSLHAWILTTTSELFRDFNKNSFDQLWLFYMYYCIHTAQRMWWPMYFSMAWKQRTKHKYTHLTVSALFIFVCTIFLLIRMSDTSVSFCGLLTVLTKIVKNLFVHARHKKSIGIYGFDRLIYKRALFI